MKNIDKNFSRSFKYNSFSIVFSIVFVVIVVMINLIVSVISKNTPLSIDLTAGDIFKMSVQTKDYVSKIEADIEITVLMDDKDLEGGGIYYAQVKNTLDEFAALNKRISVSYIDPVKNPAFLSLYSDMALSPYDILITSKEKKEKLSVTDMFNVEYDENTSAPYIASSKAEQELVGALLRITQSVRPHIALLSDSDAQYSKGMVELLEKNGYTVSSQSVANLSLDSSIDVAFLIAPKRDFSQSDVKKLNDFLVNGGEYGRTLCFAPSPVAVKQPNLEALLAQWGIFLGEGLIMETAPDKILNNTPYFCLVDYSKEDYRSRINTTAPIASPLGRDIQLIFESQGAYKVESLLNYSGGSFVLPISADDSWNPSKDDLGVRPSLIRSTYSQYTASSAKNSRLFAFASSAFFDTSVVSGTSVANGEYILSALSEITDSTDTLSIAPKNLDLKELSITKLQFMSISSIFIGIIPLATLSMGAVIWLRRKNR